MHPMMIPEDEYRKKAGWKGEWELFRAARASHSVKHPKTEPTCDMCKLISRNINRLAAEGEELVNSLKECYEEGKKLL